MTGVVEVGLASPSIGPRYWPGPRHPRASTIVADTGVGAENMSIESAGRCLVALAERVQLPLPFAGALHQRWLWLAEVAAADLSVARLFEGHTDAIVILAEAGHPIQAGCRYGVWASQAGGRRVSAVVDGAELVLDGVRPYSSGAHLIDLALLTVDRGADTLLVVVDVRSQGLTVEEGSWPALGMAASDSATVHLQDVRIAADAVVGPPGFYLGRPGFWPGSIGVAACWFGGTVGVCQPLVQAAVDGQLDQHGLAHLGRTWADLEAVAALLAATAEEVDQGRHLPAAGLRRSAETVRAAVERAAFASIDAVGRTLGPGPLVADPAHARRVADLGVYVRQHHAERDLAELGRLLGERPW